MAKGIPGAKYTLMRTIGMILNLAAFIIAIIFVCSFGTKGGINAAMIVGPIVGPVVFIFLLKVEFDFVDDHRPLLIAIWFGFTIALEVIIGYALGVSGFDIWAFEVIMMVAIYGLMVCWHYTLTIYKNEKQRYWIGLAVFIILWMVFGMIYYINLYTLIPAILVLISLGLVTYSEKILVSKKLMNFI